MALANAPAAVAAGLPTPGRRPFPIDAILSDGRGEKGVTLFMMHDLVHDLATVILGDKVNKKGNAVGNSCHYALLTDCSKPLQLSLSSPENTHFRKKINPFQRSSPKSIKALFFLHCVKKELCGSAFSPAKCLLILDLSGCFIQKLPGSIGQLKQLRYLHAPCIQNKKIPNCISKLSQLNYLNLRDSHYISALPESIGDVKGLMHLDLSGCVGICELPISFGELKQLVHLDFSDCHVPISEALGGFTKLQYLNLSAENTIEANRQGLTEAIGNLIKLRYLNLSRCIFSVARSDDQIDSLIGSISTLSNLEHLDLSHNFKLSSIPESIGNLRKLHTLDLSGSYLLTKLPDSMAKMVNLKVLNVVACFRLDQSALSRLNFPSLPHFVVHASNDTCSSNIVLLQSTNPDVLKIDRLENVKSAEEARSIQLKDKQKIKELTFQWTAGAERFVDDKEVLEKLVPPSSVWDLSITCYSSVSIPDWLMGIRQYLPNLWKIDLCYFPKCKNLPPLGQLPNLQSLFISHMEGLEEWDTNAEEGADELMFPKLVQLVIKHCGKLKLNENSRWLGEQTSLTSLRISDCEGIRSLPDNILTGLDRLTIRGCPTLEKWCKSKKNKVKLAHIGEVFPASLKAQKGTVIDEVHPDVLYSAVMNMPGFPEEALFVALSHLVDNKAHSSAFMGMNEEGRVSWLRNYLAKHYYEILTASGLL